MKCEVNMDVINNSFIGDNIDISVLRDINTNIFERKINEGLEFLIIVRILIHIDPSNQKESEITFVTSKDTLLKISSFTTYFNNQPNSPYFNMVWKLCYKIINPVDYENIEIFGRRNNQDEFFSSTNNNQGICNSNCGLDGYIDSNNLCQKCPLNCNKCNENECTECIDTHLLLYGNCISNHTCNTIENCTSCDILNNNQCSLCNQNYTLFNNSLLANTNCLIVDSNWWSNWWNYMFNLCY